jgi:hypothetical protein
MFFQETEEHCLTEKKRLTTHACGLWIGKCLLSSNYFSIGLHSYNMRLERVVSTMNKVKGRTIFGSTPGRDKRFSLPHNAQTGSSAQPAS